MVCTVCIHAGRSVLSANARCGCTKCAEVANETNSVVCCFRLYYLYMFAEQWIRLFFMGGSSWIWQCFSATERRLAATRGRGGEQKLSAAVLAVGSEWLGGEFDQGK